MYEVVFAANARHTVTGFSRRLAIAAMGGAGWAAGTRPFSLVATKQSTSKKAKQKCKRQTGQCIDVVTPACGGDAACLDAVHRCCPLVGQYDPAGWWECTFPSDA